jgi:predicted negative regulator of RcsB-dependent stress response
VARARMSRSELKARDEITTTLERLTENAMTRKNEIVVGLVVLLVLAAGFFGWRYYSSSKNAAAQGQLSNVISAFQDTTVKADKERFEKTIVAAQKTMADYPASQAASLAQYYMALSQDGLGDMPNAVKNLEEVIARGDSDTRPIAQFALASVYKRNNELQKAVDVLKQLDASGGFTKAVVAYELGSAAEAANQKDVAQTAYSKVVTESADSPFRSDAEAALKRMGLPIPTPVQTLPQVEVK